MANPWLAHVKSVRSQNAGMSFKNVLILAKKSYKKRGGGIASNAAAIEVDVPKDQQKEGLRSFLQLVFLKSLNVNTR